MDDISIRMTGVSKKYRLGSIGGGTLQADLQSWWARKCGRDDPNTKIGSYASQNKEFWALRDIDLTIRAGERVGIIGMNGAGKTTLLKLLSRVTAPTEGEIDIWGRVASLLEVGAGFHREMTGRENVYMNGSILGMTRKEIDEHMEEIIDFSGVREFIDTPVKRYSSGMYLKLAFSVAAHLQSEIMIMDEVLAVGDLSFQQKCLARMRRAAEQEGRTVLYVSHNMDTIRRLCDRCVVLNKGMIIYDGDTENAIAAYMDQSLGENPVDIDLAAADHPKNRRDTGIVLSRLFLNGKVMPVFGPGEDMHATVTVRSDRRVEDVAIRITMRTEADVGIGTSWSPHFDIPSGGDHEIPIELPLDSIAKGVFYISIGLYSFDEIGRPLILDHISRAFRIELTGDPVWNSQAHGYMKLPDIRM